MRKYIVTKKIIGWSIIFFLLLTTNFIGYSEEIKDLESSLNVKESIPSNDYFGLEIKWSVENDIDCLLYTSPSPRDLSTSRMPSSA